MNNLKYYNYEKKNNLNAKLLGKLEYFNPSGSVKDRAALNMIKAAEDAGILHKGDTIVENTSGNTGIGLAAFAASRGYHVTVFLEPGQSEERQKKSHKKILYSVEFLLWGKVQSC